MLILVTVVGGGFGASIVVVIATVDQAAMAVEVSTRTAIIVVLLTGRLLAREGPLLVLFVALIVAFSHAGAAMLLVCTAAASLLRGLRRLHVVIARL